VADMDWNRLAKLKNYFNQIAGIQRLYSPLTEPLNRFTKWYFDVLKNIMVVAAIQYLGRKTESVTIKAIGFFSAVLLGTYVLSFMWTWRPSFFNFKNRHVILSLVDLLLVTVIVVGLLRGIGWLIDEAITELTNAQGR
jgi:hypothetical protein